MSQIYQTSVNPFTRQNIFQIPYFNEMLVQEVIKNCDLAKKEWSVISIEDRFNYLEILKKEILKNKEELAEIIAKEIGCPISQTRAEVDKTASIFDYYIKHGKEYLDDEIIEENDKVKNVIKYLPLGTHLHISPYNYPLYLAFRPIIPALVAGNTILLKTPSNTPLLASKLIEIINASGLPSGVLNVLITPGSEVKKIIEDDRVNIVSIIGSEKAGKSVAAIAGENIKKSILELGGSDPFIVFEDADIDKAVEGAIFSRTRNAGQSCNAAKRFIIHKNVKNIFIQKLQEKFNDFVYGNPLEDDVNYSPLATEKGLFDALEQINKSINKGAKLVCGGVDMPECGYMLAPTILDNVTTEMEVFFEETFAPIFAVTEFSSTQEAFELANKSEYGLGASVWTKTAEIQQTAINILEVGNVFVNSIVRGNISMPYGGVKKSGYGREFSKVGIREFTNIKTVSIAK